MKQKLLAIFILTTFALTLVFATASSNALAASPPKIEEIEYKGSGYVEVEFHGSVKYSNAKVSVKDSSGKAYSASITKKDSDDLKFKVSNIALGKTYTFTISGIKKSSEGSYTSVKGTFKVPAAKLAIEEIEYDHDDKELSIEFIGKVEWKNATVTISDSNGKTYTSKFTEKEDDGCEIYVKGLKYKSSYKFKITGIRAKGSSEYTSISGSFKAIDD